MSSLIVHITIWTSIYILHNCLKISLLALEGYTQSDLSSQGVFELNFVFTWFNCSFKQKSPSDFFCSSFNKFCFVPQQYYLAQHFKKTWIETNIKYSKYSCSYFRNLYILHTRSDFFVVRPWLRGLGTPSNSSVWLFIPSLPGTLLSQFHEQKNVPTSLCSPLSLLLCVRDYQGALLALAVLPKAEPHPTGDLK